MKKNKEINITTNDIINVYLSSKYDCKGSILLNIIGEEDDNKIVKTYSHVKIEYTLHHI